MTPHRGEGNMMGLSGAVFAAIAAAIAAALLRTCSARTSPALEHA
jgi:hypothetical protein